MNCCFDLWFQPASVANLCLHMRSKKKVLRFPSSGHSAVSGRCQKPRLTNYMRSRTISIGWLVGDPLRQKRPIRGNPRQHVYLSGNGFLVTWSSHVRITCSCRRCWPLSWTALKTGGLRSPARCGQAKQWASKWKKFCTTRNPNFRMFWFLKGERCSLFKHGCLC